VEHVHSYVKKNFFSVGEHFVEWNYKEQETKQWQSNIANSYCTG